MRKRIHPLFLTVIAFVLIRCAHQISPTGGDEDLIPPEVTEVFPTNGTTNFSEHYFEISFSEYIQKSSAREAVFISPAIEGDLEYSWTGKTLEIEFEDTLKSNTTYNVTIGTDLQDYNNRNNMAQAYSFVFSTGDSIDTGVLRGKIYDDNPSGIMVYAYLQRDTLVNPITQKPDYISQVGEDGFFIHKGLAKGNYNIYAIRDDFRDYKYNIGEDSYGVPFKPIVLTGSDSLITDINFKMTKEDTIPASIVSVVMTDEAHLQIEFSEFIDSTRINRNNLFIYDSTENIRHEIMYFYSGKAKPLFQFVSLKDSLKEESSLYLISEELHDLSGNVSAMSSTLLTVNSDPDTIAPSLSKIVTEFDNNFMDYEKPYMTAIFDDGFDAGNLAGNVKMFQDSIEIKTEINAIDGSSFIVIPENQLEHNKDYKVTIDLSVIKDAKENFIDSVYTVKLKTKNKLDFTSVSGVIDGVDGKNVVVNLKSASQKNLVYKTKMNEKNKYSFDRILPGKYIAWSYVDADSNNIHSKGNVFPIKLAEPFSYYPDTLDAKARWPIVDVEIDF